MMRPTSSRREGDTAVDILIVGGTGVISTGITRQLAARADHVTVANRAQTEGELPPGVAQIVADRTDALAFEAAMAAAGPWDCVIDMRTFTPAEAESTVRAFRGRTRQLIFCSTVDIYAKPATTYPIGDDEPRSTAGTFIYGVQKAQCEEILLAAGERGDFAATIIRPAYTYGEGSRGILHTFGWATTYLDRLRRGKPVVVHGDGTSLWVACHRDDVARAFANAAGNPATFGRAYHVTGEDWMTWDRFTARTAAALGAPAPEIVHIPTDLLRAAVPRRAFWCAENFRFNNIFDNSAARADLGFRYTIDFDSGVRRAIGWLLARDRIEDSDNDPFDDRLIAAYRRLGADMAAELAGLNS
jgi:nucleoside-diphosphate-sugar epimerase